jgi:DNA replication and repair protein RecF
VARRRYIETLSPLLARAFDRITGSGLDGSVRYGSSFEVGGDPDDSESVAKALHAALRGSLARDRARGATSVGPHRDELGFFLAGQPAASFASQGQLRALVLAWKTAEMELLDQVHRSPPILLLDDVSSELDETRNRYLFAFLRERVNQCFITTTAAHHVLIERDRRQYAVVSGRVAPVAR